MERSGIQESKNPRITALCAFIRATTALRGRRGFLNELVTQDIRTYLKNGFHVGWGEA
jgi:hypothetical protein